MAYAAERRSAARKSLVSNPYVYALSMAVYCTAWTYYGSVGRAAHHGLEFVSHLPRAHAAGAGLVAGAAQNHSGVPAAAPHLHCRFYFGPLRQKRLAGRLGYGGVRAGHRALHRPANQGYCRFLCYHDRGRRRWMCEGARRPLRRSTPRERWPFFTIIFGVRSVEATERHEGMVLAVAVESLVKLVAFLVRGLVRHVRPVRWLRRRV